MRDFLLGLYSLGLGRESGGAGHKANASSSCCWWHTIGVGLQTVLLKEVCPILNAALCDQAEETIEHLLISCVFYRQVWYNILHKVGLQDLSLQPDNNSFDGWWASTNSGVDDQTKKRPQFHHHSGSLAIWNYCNRCVFDGIQLSLNSVLVSVKDEFLLWSLARGWGISNLLALEPANV
jgi:hypothetical protein